MPSSESPGCCYRIWCRDELDTSAKFSSESRHCEIIATWTHSHSPMQVRPEYGSSTVTRVCDQGETLLRFGLMFVHDPVVCRSTSLARPPRGLLVTSVSAGFSVRRHRSLCLCSGGGPRRAAGKPRGEAQVGVRSPAGDRSAQTTDAVAPSRSEN
jgi:hypothetical protein